MGNSVEYIFLRKIGSARTRNDWNQQHNVDMLTMDGESIYKLRYSNLGHVEMHENDLDDANFYRTS